MKTEKEYNEIIETEDIVVKYEDFHGSEMESVDSFEYNGLEYHVISKDETPKLKNYVINKSPLFSIEKADTVDDRNYIWEKYSIAKNNTPLHLECYAHLKREFERIHHIKYHISVSELMRLENEHKVLREILDAGKYVYCDGYICLNNKSLFVRENGHLTMRNISRRMMKAYCLGILEIPIEDKGEKRSCVKFIRAENDRG